MAYRAVELGMWVRLDPERAKREIRRAYRKAKNDVEKAAKILGVTRRTLDRYTASLQIRRQLVE